MKKCAYILGRVVYQAAAAGSYSPMEYEISIPLVTTAAIVLIVAGIVQIAVFAFGCIPKKSSR